ncbi:unnamed protein product [Rotaria sp. Silwood2]|nr:unnamed protein product [Rotaria sp. Silwood2]CAF2781185.1 unnamed protein product [Rotaria sp. Silwood2]
MRDIQGKYSNDLKTWSNKWISTFEQNTSSLAYYESTQKMLISISSIGYELAKKIDHSHRQLRHLSKLIPTEEKYPSSESQLEQARTAVNSVQNRLIAYEKDLNKLKDRLNRISNQLREPSLNQAEKSKLKSKRSNVKVSIEEMKDNVEYARKMYQQAEKKYHKDSVIIFEEGQENELDRLQILKDTLAAFLEALDIKHGSFQEAIQNHNPTQDLNVWKQKFFSSPIRSPNAQ